MGLKIRQKTYGGIFLSRDFPHHWLEILFDIVEVPFELALNPSCQENEGQRNGYQTVNEGDNFIIRLVDGFMSNDKQQKSFAKVRGTVCSI